MGLIGLNVVRPLQRRLDENTVLMIVGIVLGVAAVLAVSLLLRKRCGWYLQNVPMERLSPALCAAFVVYDTVVYLFISTDEPAIRSMDQLHNILVVVSCAAVAAFCGYLARRNRGTAEQDQEIK